MGRLVGEATPTIDTVLALIKLRECIAQQAPVQVASSGSGANRVVESVKVARLTK